jgi:tetraacyldisaccharide 4'-kinase
MRPPAFWANPPDQPGIIARALSPLGALYAATTARRLLAPGYTAKIPVICIGNLNAGGTGKTPTTIALIERLAQRGHTSVHIVSRGYGGKLSGPIRVDPARHTAADVGDEPLLLTAFAATWVSRDRAAGVKAAEANGATAILLDDGFQNPSVTKSLSIIVVDAGIGFGNGRCIPAGPLREPVTTGLARADFLLSIGAPADQTRFTAQWGPKITPPQLTGHHEPIKMGMDWHGLRVLAFAGIGNPEKFFTTLRDQGAILAATVALDDHQPLSAALLQRLQAQAKSLHAQLVTTEKDAVRLPDALRSQVLTLPVRLQLNDWSPLDAALAKLGL